MRNTKTFKTLAGATLGVASLGATFALADTNQINTQNTNSNIERKQGFQNLTSSQKEALKQAHTLIKEGKQDEAKKVLDAAGLQSMKEMRGGKQKKADMNQVEQAIISGDYASFKTAASGTALQNITQEVFNSLKAPTAAKQAADAQIQNILKNAGIEMKHEKNISPTKQAN
ncbi:MAG: hypothetical protein QG614_241 [Patescibacteria group bacterium]|nr:hypothetical protein [Patescibacteria group bacterium]